MSATLAARLAAVRDYMDVGEAMEVAERWLVHLEGGGDGHPLAEPMLVLAAEVDRLRAVTP